MMYSVPDLRIRALNRREERPDGAFVLYWMTANRRTRFNFALQHAVDRARALRRPLLVLEALRCDYRWASERFHRFILNGMLDNQSALARTDAHYYPYVEPKPGAGKGLIAALSRHACTIVTDDFPAFMLPRMIEAGAARSEVKFEAVDSNGILPMDAADRAFPTAYAFRRFLQRELRDHLVEFPLPDPLARVKLRCLKQLPGGVEKSWPRADPRLLSGVDPFLASMRLDSMVGTTSTAGGMRAARAALRPFIARLERYAEERNRLDVPVTSGLSPYLHFGHLSSHEVCRSVLDAESWSPEDLAETTTGSRQGWWGLSPSAEGFLDQIVTWRELGYNMCRRREDYASFDSLPDWALRTLTEHADDPRDPVYTLEQFERAATHDELWNAAQTQLRRDGVIHNYLRMLWGKKILHWSSSPREALQIMIELNNKYALDGRNPNSYSGIFWVLGRYDRAWGPERPIFGKIRFMSSRNTTRKLKTKEYLKRYGEGSGQSFLQWAEPSVARRSRKS